MIMRFDPFRDTDRLWDEVFGRQYASRVPMDAVRRGDHVEVSLDLPGVDPSSIDLTVERNVLSVRAERRDARRDGDEVIAAERRHGTYSRQIFLGDTLDAANIGAHYAGGVLVLDIPVSDAAKPRKVAVTAGVEQPQEITEVPASD